MDFATNRKRKVSHRLEGKRLNRGGVGWAGHAVRLESLENRLMMAVDPIITEFMASNDSTLRDADQQYSDWLEIANPGAEPINLTGWKLADSEIGRASCRERV